MNCGSHVMLVSRAKSGHQYQGLCEVDIAESVVRVL